MILVLWISQITVQITQVNAKITTSRFGLYQIVVLTGQGQAILSAFASLLVVA